MAPKSTYSNRSLKYLWGLLILSIISPMTGQGQSRQSIGIEFGRDYFFSRQTTIIGESPARSRHLTDVTKWLIYYQRGPRDSASGFGYRLYLGAIESMMVIHEPGHPRERYTEGGVHFIPALYYQWALSRAVNLKAYGGIGLHWRGRWGSAFSTPTDTAMLQRTNPTSTTLRYGEGMGPALRATYRVGLSAHYVPTIRWELGVFAHHYGLLGGGPAERFYSYRYEGQAPTRGPLRHYAYSESRFSAIGAGVQIGYRVGLRARGPLPRR